MSSTLPNLNAWLAENWGWGAETPDIGWLAGFSNIAIGNNPVYTASDFLKFYPGFGGTPVTATAATVTAGSSTLTIAVANSALAPGQLIISPSMCLASGTIIVSASGTTVTINPPVVASGVAIPLTIFTAPLLPLVVLSAYIALASASLQFARWADMWQLAMALYVAHFATLYLRSDGNIYTTAGQKAAAGLNAGITISKSAGAVSQGLQIPEGLEDWASWTITSYGQQLATFARIVGSGPCMVF